MSILSPLKSLLHGLGMSYVRAVCAREYANQSFSGINERPIEFAFLFRHLVALWPKKILDVGTGKTSLPHLMCNCGFHVTATDNIKDYWPSGMMNRHYHVINDDITSTKLTSTYDVITCISVLEHIERYDAAISSMFSLLVPGGHLIVTFPYNATRPCANVYDLLDSDVKQKFSFKTRAFCRRDVERWVSNEDIEIVDQEYWSFYQGEYWTCGPRIAPPVKTSAGEAHQMACFLLRKL